MSETSKQKSSQEKPQVEKKSKPIDPVFYEFKNDLQLIEKSFSQKEPRYLHKVLRAVRKYRNCMKAHHLKQIFEVFPNTVQYDFSKLDGFDQNFTENLDIQKNFALKQAKNPEFTMYLKSLVLVFLVKHKILNEAELLVNSLIQEIQSNRLKNMESLYAIVYFYFSRIYELKGNLKQIRTELYNAYRTCCVIKDEIGQATLLNLLLKNLIHSKNYEAASQLVSKSTFPEGKSNNELVRYLYYTGKIKAIQLDYAEAYSRLMQAIRKTPDNVGLGFKIQVQKLAIIIELLLGQIPQRTIFSNPQLKSHLVPYYFIVKSVIRGNLNDFRQITAKYQSQIQQDDILTLVNRLNHTVIKTGLRRINLSYSKISFQDIAQRLHLDEETDVEFIIAKAIRDGVISAVINHNEKTIEITENKDIYRTSEPQLVFEKRISNTLELNNAANKALQYPNQQNQYQEREKQEDFDPDEFLQIMEDDEDF